MVQGAPGVQVLAEREGLLGHDNNDGSGNERTENSYSRI